MIRRLLPALPLLALLLFPAALSPAWAIDRPEDLLPDPAQEERAREIGQAALARIRAEHTYALRGAQVDALFKAHARQPEEAGA